MSTMIALLLVLSSLVGCAGETLTNVKNALPDLPPETFSFSVELEEYEETVRDEDGAALVECSYALPVMKALAADGSVLETAATEGQAQALAAAETFNARFDPWKGNAQTLAKSAKEDRAFRNESGLEPMTYTDDLWCAVYQTETLVSVSGTYSTYTGGAHPNHILMSWNFDLEAGEFFEPEILDEGGDLREYVRSALVRQVREADEVLGEKLEDLYWEDYEDILADWLNYAISFDAEGMTVGFSPYELAAYAAGPQTFHLTYEELSPHLGPHGKALLGLEAASAGESAG
nr:DUF3298 and DUF4163 domain-containing protein [uncultured Oscillibacter sp.]